MLILQSNFHGWFIVKLFFASLFLLVTSTYGVAAPTASLLSTIDRSILSVENIGQTRAVIMKNDYKEYIVYGKWELNCADSTVRYLGTSTSLTSFNPELQDKYFMRASDNVSASVFFDEACRIPADSLTASQ
jgi:hypothetical protein